MPSPEKAFPGQVGTRQMTQLSAVAISRHQPSIRTTNRNHCNGQLSMVNGPPSTPPHSPMVHAHQLPCRTPSLRYPSDCRNMPDRVMVSETSSIQSSDTPATFRLNHLLHPQLQTESQSLAPYQYGCCLVRVMVRFLVLADVDPRCLTRCAITAPSSSFHLCLSALLDSKHRRSPVSLVRFSSGGIGIQPRLRSAKSPSRSGHAVMTSLLCQFY